MVTFLSNIMTESLSLDGTAARLSQILREKEEKRAQERCRHLLYLIADFLGERGCKVSRETLFKEAQLSKDLQVCDNIDLETIMMEYTSYYYAKFNKYPKFCKKIELSGTGSLENAAHSKKEKVAKRPSKQEENRSNDETSTGKHKTLHKTNDLDFSMMVKPIFPNDGDVRTTMEPPEKILYNERILKPIAVLYPPDSELYGMAENISREIVVKHLNVRWSDIKGLDHVKDDLKRSIVYPMKYPTSFSSKFCQSKGVLLYGPPGTGKTMLAKAIATECRCTFFNITASSIVSKWRGDSEKYIRVLMDLAHYYAPSIIFIDEIDWMSAIDDASPHSEAARRFRAELLARFDGLLSVDNSRVIILGATNIPWKIDAALVRRLEERIYVDLPDENTRKEILQFYVDKKYHNVPMFLEIVTQKTCGYSCAELKSVCNKVYKDQMRKTWIDLENNKISLNDVKTDCVTDINLLHFYTNRITEQPKNVTNQYDKWIQNHY